MSKIKENKKLLILLIAIVMFTVLGGTYALYKLVLFDDLNVNFITKGLDYYINYEKGSDFNGGLNLCEDYTEGNSVGVTLYKKNNKYAHIYGHIYLKINEIGTNLRTIDGLKYTVADANGEITSGTLKGVENKETILISPNIDLSVDVTEYRVYVWLDKSMDIPSTISGENFSSSVVVEATQKPINETNFDGREVVPYENMTPVEKINYDIALTANWFNNQRNKALNNEETATVYDEWIEKMGGNFPTCPSSSEEDLATCFYDDSNVGGDSNIDLYTIGGDIFNVIGLGNKGINFNTYHTMAFINESTNEICVTFKLMRQYNYYYGELEKDEDGTYHNFITDEGYPIFFKSSGC